jgi:hypothetical protein
MLPIPLAAQFVSPLPFSSLDGITFFDLVGRFTWGWYFIGGTALFYFLFISWRKNEGFGIWPWWAAVCYACIAYVMAGSVARYVIPVQPLFIPVATFVLCRLREGRWRKAYAVWAICFTLLIIATLLLCLEIQQGAVSKFFNTEPLLPMLRDWMK